MDSGPRRNDSSAFARRVHFARIESTQTDGPLAPLMM